RLRQIARRIDPERPRIAVDHAVGGKAEIHLAGARDDRGAVRDVGQADALVVIVRGRLRQKRRGRRGLPRRLPPARRERGEGDDQRAFHDARSSERSTTIFVTSAIFITALPILRSSDMRLRRTASSSTMTITSLKNVSSSGAMAANDSRAR